MGPQEIKFIRDTFKLSQKDLARALNIAPYTVARWEMGENEPTGLQEEVVRALYTTAVRTSQRKDAETATVAIGAVIGLGIGALILSLLNAEATRPAPKRRG